MKRSLLCSLMCLLGSVAELPARTWTEATTGKKIEAEFVSVDEKVVTISMQGGVRFTLALARLSPEDKAFVRQQRKAGRAHPMTETEVKSEDRFKDVVGLKANKIPSQGMADPSLEAVDTAIRHFMADKGVPALTIAVSRNGKILHDRAFGWADADLKTPLQSGVKMRLASLTKPVVCAAIQTLVDDRKLKPDEPVYKILGLEEYKEAKGCDPRWKTVTVQHLLEHKGGWDREKSGDSASRSKEIREMFRIKPHEIEPMHVVRYGLTLPMDFDPGSKDVYSNYGYILLARVVEKISGQKFVNYIQGTIGQQSKASSFCISSTDASNRQAGEIWYCYHPEHPEKEVPLSFHMEARDGAAALACTAADYCRFLETYWISGKPRKESGYHYTFNGSYPGTISICAQRLDGLNYTAIMNRRGGEGDWNSDLRKVIDAALDPVADKVK